MDIYFSPAYYSSSHLQFAMIKRYICAPKSSVASAKLEGQLRALYFSMSSYEFAIAAFLHGK
jgi:hypothetical protein